MRKKLVFSSMDELVEYATSDKSRTKNRHSHRRGAEWAGTDSFKEAMELVKTGWRVGVRDFAYRLDQLKRVQEDGGLGYYYDVEGLMLDVGTYLQGQPECFLMEEPAIPKEVVKVVVNVAANVDTPTDFFKNRGAAIVSLVDALTKRHVVELWAVTGAIRYDGSSIIEIWVKLETNPVDLDQVAFVLAHPSFLRRIVFAAGEVLTNTAWSSFYRAHNVSLGGDSIYFPIFGSREQQWSSVESSAKEISRILNYHQRRDSHDSNNL